MFQSIKLILISFILLSVVGCGGGNSVLDPLIVDQVEEPEIPEEIEPEVEVEPVNVAVGKIATQSSDSHSALASRAVDGNSDGIWRNNSVTHTAEEAQPWWQVDLGSVENISEINLFNRTDNCCVDRLSNFYVLVSETDFESNDLNESISQSGVASYYNIPTVNGSTSINIGAAGRYVRIQLVGTNVLSLAEVEVMSVGNIEVEPNPIEPNPIEPVIPDPITPSPIDPELVDLYEFGSTVYAQKCAECHDQLEVSKKRGAIRQDIVNSLNLPQMSNIDLNDEELDALAYVLNNPHPETVEVVETPIELTGGALIFEQQCSTCHGEDADQFFPLLVKHTDLDSITEYTETTMPPTGPETCVGECASLVAEYILTLEPAAGELTVEDIGTQRLKRSHYYRTIEFLVGEYSMNIDSLSHPADPIVEGFKAGSEVNSTLVYAYHLNAGILAKDLVLAVEADNEIIGCENLEADCVRDFYLDFAEQAYRFPLEDEQIQLLDLVFGASNNDPLVGIGNVVGYVLQSPYFLYYLNSDDDTTDYTLANQLSFTLWNEPPDAELLTLAGQGELSSPIILNQQVDRLLADDKGQQTFLDFASQWLGLDRVQQVTKDTAAIPGFTTDVVAELERDLLAFVETSLQEPDSFEYLFNGEYQLSNDLASTLSQWNNEVQNSRTGVMSQPGMLAILSGPVERSPILRGAYVMDKLLCDHREPVDAIDDVIKDIVIPEDASPRLRTEILTESPVCQACHASINPLGFGFEDFDGLGLPIGENTLETIQIPATDRADSVSLSFNGIEDLQQQMLQTHQFYDCAVDKMLGYANLIERPSEDSTDEIYDEFRDSADLKALLKAIVLTMIENN